jgi:DNA-nicking Smr family endonuclease
MTEQDARAMLKTALETSQMLNILAADLIEGMGEGEARILRTNIGNVLAEIGERLISPVFDEHPQLEPENTGDAWRELAKSVGARDMREV